ncbi:hypothetical protein JCM10914A_49220 [Paenibacillus sp. JCM 10914]|uniref:DUF4179 domain-containing protein n=1 Tax=Paenibacillus sp. JCM 10914 TaxID=1236974 RepID=UPI0003CC830C|nr:DUF4179 domain-containing protein [Paenibacillus sp. JCM 10914]GAE08952.1 hypothetical protein JCM10914_5289 [Paenibacillus sp. JCM 10914]
MNYHDPIDRELEQLLKSSTDKVVIPDTVLLAVENALSSLPEQKVKPRFSAKRWRWAAAVFALIFVIGTVSIFTVPTFAEMIRSLFAKDHPDIGLLRAQELGLVHDPQINVKDKGYTLEINEAVADPTRVTMALQLFDSRGKHVRDKLILTEPNQITIKDDNGNLVKTMYDMGYTNDFYYMVAFFGEPLQTEKITIEGNITTLGSRGQPQTEGDWKFSFDMDMREANKKTQIEELSGSYTTPHGMTVTLKSLTRMVQGVRLELETELDEVAMTRSPGDLWEKQMLSFHFETLQGEEIHSVNPRKSYYKDGRMTSEHKSIGHGKVLWSYTFKHLPEEEPFRLVLDGYTVAEVDGSQISYRPSEQTEPQSFKILNDNVEIVGTSLEESQSGDGTNETAISFYGEMENEITHTEWKAYDSTGRQYDVSMRGGASVINALSDDWREGLIGMGDRTNQQPIEFRIPGLDQIPEELTLVREVVDKRYKDPDWSVIFNK